MNKNIPITIGLATTNIFGDYLKCQWEAIDKTAEELNVNLIIFSPIMFYTNETFHEDLFKSFELATPRNIQGLIISAGTFNVFFQKENIKHYISRFKDIPVVTLAQSFPGIPSILIDGSKGMEELVEHFIRYHNYRKIAFIKGPENNSEASERFQAYKSVMEKNGIPVDENLILPGDFGIHSGCKAVKELLDVRKIKPEAILAANDDMILGVMEELQDRQIKVPEEIALGGFDDIETVREMTPPITSVKQPFTEQAEQAVKLLIQMIDGKQVSGDTVLSTQPVFRSSCGCSGKKEKQNNLSSDQNPNNLNHKTVSLMETRKGYALGEINQFFSYLINTVNRDEIKPSMERLFGKFKITDCLIAFYDKGVPLIGEEAQRIPPEKAEVYFAFKGSRKIDLENRWFETENLYPGENLFFTKRETLICSELLSQNEHYGFFILDLKSIDPLVLNLLKQQFTSTLKYFFTNIRLQEAYSKLKDMDQVKSQFFANISHEMRTPLTLIQGPLESFLAGEYGQTLHRKDSKVRAMLNNSLMLSKLINHLLDILKIEEDRMPVVRKKTNIPELLRFYISSIIPGAESKGISLEFINNSTDKNFKAWTDRDLLEKAFFNLISNALKFTPSGGGVTVFLDTPEENCFSIRIHDTGIGIPADKLNLIFERFTQLDSSITKKYTGTGIGLAFVKNIVKLLEGNISVQSCIKDGSTFTMTFPIKKQNQKEVEEEAFSEINNYLITDINREHKNEEPAEDLLVFHEMPKILIVEDNRDVRIFLQSILKSQYLVLMAANGKEGLKLAKKEHPQIILTDVMMPEMDGIEMTRLIKQTTELKSIPVIMLTAKADIEQRIEGLRGGADDYLGKPFNSRELLARIKSALEMKKLRDELAIQNEFLSGKKDLLQTLVAEQITEIEKERNIAVDLRKMTEKQLQDFLMVLASAIESKDHYTGGHVERVADYSRDIALNLNLPFEEVRDIFLGAIVHDVGKIGIKDIILNKPGKLTPDEFEEMKKHTIIGKQLLEKIENIPVAVSIAHHHQERWDGGGYPEALKTTEIPLAARIVTIADVWDAITTDRPYREAMTVDKAVTIMQNERGKAFDPRLLDIFLDEEEGIYKRYL